MSADVVGVEFERAPIFSLGLHPVPPLLLGISEKDMGAGKGRIKFQSLARGIRCSHALRFRGSTADQDRGTTVIREAQADISGGKCRVFINCLSKIANALIDISSGV